MTLNPLVIINVARKNLFYDYKAKDKRRTNIKPRLSNQRDYLEQLKNMQVKILC
jgi:hypothetical protein